MIHADSITILVKVSWPTSSAKDELLSILFRWTCSTSNPDYTKFVQELEQQMNLQQPFGEMTTHKIEYVSWLFHGTYVIIYSELSK